MTSEKEKDVPWHLPPVAEIPVTAVKLTCPSSQLPRVSHTTKTVNLATLRWNIETMLLRLQKKTEEASLRKRFVVALSCCSLAKIPQGNDPPPSIER